MSRGTTAVISIANLKHNFKVLNDLAPSKLVLVVKADAYGHGLKRVVKALDQAECFGVATIEEALTVRKVNADVKVLLLEGFLDEKQLKIAYENCFDCVIHQKEQLEMLDNMPSEQRINVWLKYDSGMNRLGFSGDEYVCALEQLKHSQKVAEVVLMSHFASADIKNNVFTQQQKEKFLDFTDGRELSLSNSAALLNGYHLPDEWCRVGIALFGVSPIADKKAEDFGLEPVMTLKTNVIAIKNVVQGQSIGYAQKFFASKSMKIAIIGIGYGDGFPWNLSDQAFLKVKNHKAKIVGRISMDMLAIDVTNVDNITLGDSVIIWGQDEKTHLPIEILAKHAGTIPYVLLCQITSRVHYHYDNK